MKRLNPGDRYGRLVVIEIHFPKDEVLCACDCGNKKIVRATNVFYGGTKSCGCLKNEGNNKKHGEHGTRLYGIWKGIRERCNTPSSTSFKKYGARGIKVCEEWNQYENFKEWALSNGYNDALTIDRIDYNGNYEPSNCRWATYKQQANNTRKTRHITAFGKTMTLTEWAEMQNIKPSTLWNRIYVLGWNVEKAVSVKTGCAK